MKMITFFNQKKIVSYFNELQTSPSPTSHYSSCNHLPNQFISETTPPQPGFDPAPPCTTTLSSSSIPAGCIQNFHHSVFPCFEFKLLFSLWDPPWNFKGYSYNSNMTSSRFYRKESSKFYSKKSSRFYIKFFPIIFMQVEANQSIYVVNMLN